MKRYLLSLTLAILVVFAIILSLTVALDSGEPAQFERPVPHESIFISNDDVLDLLYTYKREFHHCGWRPNVEIRGADGELLEATPSMIVNSVLQDGRPFSRRLDFRRLNAGRYSAFYYFPCDWELKSALLTVKSDGYITHRTAIEVEATQSIEVTLNARL